MYKPEKVFSNRYLSVLGVTALCFSSITYAATLGQRAVYTVNIIPWSATPTEYVGQCSAFTFGDVSTICAGGFPSVLVDNQVLGPPALVGGDGIPSDGLAGTISIQTGLADVSGNNTFTILSFQMDPYLATSGGIFKTTMSPPDGQNTGSGTFNALGNMTLDLTGRTGVAQFFEAPPPASIGIAAWNIDDSTNVAAQGDPVTGLYQEFTTGNSTNYDPSAGGALISLTGRPIGDANTDTVLDAVLVSAGNVGTAWDFFDGTPYSEAFNVQFVLVSADPVAVDDVVATSPSTPLIINIATDLLINDTHAASEALTFDSFTPPVDVGSTLVSSGGGTTLTYTPGPGLIGAAADSFTYTISDVGGQTDTATVSVNVATGTPPVANDDAITTNEDTAITVDPVNDSSSVPGVVIDTDANGDTLVLYSFDVVSANAGTVVAAGGDSVTYTPPLNFSGTTDTFDYTIHDGNGNLDTATVTVTVNTVNDAPVCTDVAFITATDTALDIDIANELVSTTSVPPLCTDIEGDAVTLATFDPVSMGGGTVTSDGTALTYTPLAGFQGTDTFTFTATDGNDDAVPNTVTVDVADPSLGNFTMLNAGGNTFGGTNDVVFDWDETLPLNTSESDTNFNLEISSAGPTPFNGAVWVAHDTRAFGPGTYYFETDNSVCTVAVLQATGCPGTPGSPTSMEMVVGPDQVGVHILFDWNGVLNIDVVNVWDKNAVWDDYGDIAPRNALFLGPGGVAPDATKPWEYVSISQYSDSNGPVHGSPMIDGAFIGYYANFNAGPGGVGEALPPITTEAPDTSLGASSMSAWTLLTGFFSLFGLRAANRKVRR